MKEKQKKPIYKKWWFYLLVVAVAFAIFGGGDEEETVAKITPDEYNQLKKGMTYEELVDIVGGIEKKKNEVSATIVEYTFDGEDGKADDAVISLLFVNEKLDTLIEDGLLGDKVEYTTPEKETTPDEEIKQVVEKIIEEDLDNTTISQLMVNENAGLDDGSYIVLPHLVWSVENGAKNTKNMLEMYSDHLAAKLAEYNVSEVTVFWEVPYHLEGDNVAKFNYQRQGDGMAIGGRNYFGPLN